MRKMIASFLVAGAVMGTAGVTWFARSEDGNIAVTRTTPAASAAASTAARASTLSTFVDRRDELAALLSAVDGAETDQDVETRISDAYFEMVARIKSDPSWLSTIEAMLADADRASSEARVLVGALVGVGTPDAQRTFLRVLGKRKDDDDFLRLLIPSMGFFEAPTSETEAALRDIANSDTRREARNMADLSTGILAWHVQETEPARAREIVNRYGASLATATDVTDIRSRLAVLGNAGTTDAAQFIQKFVSDERSDVRSQAIEALRRVPTPEAEKTLLASLQKEANEDVRASAAWALSNRAPTTDALRTQVESLEHEPSEKVAKTLLQNLWFGLSQDRELVIAAVTRAAKEHPNAAVREQAQQLLASNGKS